MNKKSLSERDICTKFITPALEKAGWDKMDQIREEVTFIAGRVIVRGKIHRRENMARKPADKIFSAESLEMTFQVAGLDEIKQWIMSLGPEAYVIKPEKLKNMVKADLKKTLVQYEGTRPAYLRPQARKSRSNYFN